MSSILTLELIFALVFLIVGAILGFKLGTIWESKIKTK